MSWRFRQSFTVIPGLRLNLSKRGVSASIGGAPFTMNIGPHGVSETFSVPGTGLSYRHHENGSRKGTAISEPSPVPHFALPPAISPSLPSAAQVEYVHSASTELMTSESLKAVKQLIHAAHQQREEISQQLTAARDERRIAEERFRDWDGGFLLKRIFKKHFAERQSRLETENAKVEELEEQLRLSTIETHIEVAKEQADFYFRLRDEFAAMCECAAIWDIKSHQATDRARERTTAAQRIDRHKVKFGLSTCDLIQWEQKIPHLQNSKGGDLYLYPGFVLYRAAKEAFSVIDYHELSGRAEMKSFIEDETVPADSEVIGQTWAKSNKDGSRDKRFADNYQIPVARYGQVTLKSSNGLWEEFQFSNPQRLLNFLNALNQFTGSFASES